MTEYLLSQQGAPAVEQARLKLLAEYHDPMSIRQLDAIGVGGGWRCLDAGAGGGAVTRILAQRVGSGGSVLAVDLDTTLLDALASDTVTVRRLNVLSDPLPPDTFDLVHARLLLMHLPSRVAALRQLVAATRHGGWLASIEPDFTTVAMWPDVPVWGRVWSALCDATVAGGWDPRYGARLLADLRTVGLAEVQADHVRSSDPGGSLVAQLLSLTFERLRERMVDLGANHDDIDEARRLLADPANTFTSPTTCVARARRA